MSAKAFLSPYQCQTLLHYQDVAQSHVLACEAHATLRENLAFNHSSCSKCIVFSDDFYLTLTDKEVYLEVTSID